MSAREATGLAAGAGRAALALPPSFFPVDGFDGVLDPLHARVLVLEQAGRRTVIVSVELTSVPDGTIATLQRSVAAATGAEADDVLVVATHTFSAPHVPPAGAVPSEDAHRNGGVATALEQAVLVAAAAAAEAVRPARLAAGRSAADVAVNRDVRTRDGWWLGSDEDGVTDKTVAVVRVDGLDGGTIAVLLNAAVQSSVLNESRTRDGRRLVSADLAGAAARHLERELHDAVALFLPGAAGDQAPALVANRTVLDRDGATRRVDVHEAGHVLVELVGERLGAAALRAALAAVPGALHAPLLLRCVVSLPGQVAPASFRDLRPTTSYEFVPADDEQVPFWLLRLGDTVLVGVRPELSAVTGLRLRERSPFRHTLVATMTNGAAKYLPDATAYDRMTYEAMSARYARGAAEILEDEVVAALEELVGRA